ncbi:GAF and ANTAR domain-containing protein [Rhodococcus sp. 14C212]|uniref:ANTAR domain-containing protein n=1 Tax=Rhodococcus sp. 14C212 TaxID=2711209 RepID=UPI0013EC78DE|nr:GAF and ANTAR domain-containing protein [Rhodococcus sp. 14C212]NGP05724.1 GAF and ANTAR domain-containing protein [Rhodococcus sp. 14C212]
MPGVVEIDADQYRTGQGPCLAAAGTGRVVRVRVDDLPERRPAFSAAVRGIGVRSYLSAPLRLGGEHVGALHLYSYHDHGFSDLDAVLLKIHTGFGETLVGLSRDLDRARHEVDTLTTALTTRGVIEQAKGVLRARRGLSGDSAFEALVEISQRDNVKLAVIARRIVTELDHPRR